MAITVKTYRRYVYNTTAQIHSNRVKIRRTDNNGNIIRNATYIHLVGKLIYGSHKMKIDAKRLAKHV